MEQKPGWTYSFIESLNMHIAINNITRVLYTEDKTMYTPDECALLSRINYQIPPEIHIVKRNFGGTLTAVTPNQA